jgi:hypothetical protein
MDNVNHRLFAAIRGWMADVYPGQHCLNVRLTLAGGAKVVLPVPAGPVEPRQHTKQGTGRQRTEQSTITPTQENEQ